jgi:hypothetical protein
MPLIHPDTDQRRAQGRGGLMSLPVQRVGRRALDLNLS